MKNSKIMILDEATSSLDKKNETTITNLLYQRDKQTIINITH